MTKQTELLLASALDEQIKKLEIFICWKKFCLDKYLTRCLTWIGVEFELQKEAISLLFCLHFFLLSFFLLFCLHFFIFLKFLYLLCLFASVISCFLSFILSFFFFLSLSLFLSCYLLPLFLDLFNLSFIISFTLFSVLCVCFLSSTLSLYFCLSKYILYFLLSLLSPCCPFLSSHFVFQHLLSLFFKLRLFSPPTLLSDFVISLLSCHLTWILRGFKHSFECVLSNIFVVVFISTNLSSDISTQGVREWYRMCSCQPIRV